MTLRTLTRRSLRFHARSHLGVLLGAIIGSAALTGALVVGDSVRASLQNRALARLGWVNLAMATGDRFFSSELLDEQQFSSLPRDAALQLPARASVESGTARANRVNLFGFEDGQLGVKLSRLSPGNVILNETLAKQLGARTGDEILFRIQKATGISAEIAVNPRNASTLSFRLKVQDIMSGAEVGDFSLSASQIPPLNAFARLDELGPHAGLREKANLLLLGQVIRIKSSGSGRMLAGKNGTGRDLLVWWFTLKWKLGFSADFGVTYPLSVPEELSFASKALAQADSLSEFGVNLRTNPLARTVELRSDRIFLDSALIKAADQVYATNTPVSRTNAEQVLTYLANLIRIGTNTTPYSMVTAAGPPFTPPDMKDDEIILTRWLADDLHARPGDTVELSYFLPESGAKLLEATNRFRVHSVLPMELPWADRTLMPDFPGIENAESTADWDAGFPLVYKIRPKDEAYWKQYRGTPKAFITLAAGQKMWANRFGNLTSVRFPIPPGEDPQEFRDSLDKKTLANLDLSELGFHFEPVREQALKAANQAQDFGDLFLGFSIFLVVAALLLMALLFQFGLEQRATEIGTFLSLGFTPKQVRRMLLKEGTILASLGGLLGTFAGLGYAKAMLWGLTTIWRSAVGTSSLTFHASPGTLGTGLSSSIAVSTVVIGLALRKQARRPARELLAGEVQNPKSKVRSWGKWITIAAGVPAIATVGWALFARETTNAEVFFSAGSLLLIAGLGAAAAWLAALAVPSRCSSRRKEALTEVGQPQQQNIEPPYVGCYETGGLTGLFSLAVRGTVRRRTRSLATIALLACGSFLIASIGVFRLDANLNALEKTSGTGGFPLLGESTMPIVQDLNTKSGREFFGLSDRDLQGVSFIPFRVRDGDEASCLNLNRAQKPRLLGVNPSSLSGHFTFADAAKGLDRAKGWDLLRIQNAESSTQNPVSGIQHPASASDEIPAIGDANSIQWALGKKLGDTLDYTDERGHTFKLRLVGSLANSILQGSLIIDEAEFTKRFPSESGYRMFLLDVPTNSIPQVSATLSRAMQDVGFELTSTVQRLNAFNAVQNTYLGTFQILGGLGLLLGSAGLGIVVLRNVLERRGELGLLTAVGFNRGSLQNLILAEHSALLALGLGIGILSAVVAVLPAILSPAMHLPWRSLTLTLGLVLANGLIWTWLATRYALRGNLLAALRNE
jgi:ABC-type lipoprotein release transport system permease subunit